MKIHFTFKPGQVYPAKIPLMDLLFESWSPIHTYLDIFENRVFSIQFQKNMRPHVAYSNQFCTSIWKH